MVLEFYHKCSGKLSVTTRAETMPKCLFPNVHLINGLELQPRLAHKSLFSPTSLLNYRKNIPSLHFESQNQQIHKGGEKEAINFTLEEVVVYLKDFIPT